MSRVHELMDRTASKIRSQEQSVITSRNRGYSINLPNWVDDLYLNFALVYRQRWVVDTDEAEQAVKYIWAKKLAGIDEKIIRETIDECTTKFAEWPPTPGQFLEIAVSKARLAKEKSEDEKRITERNQLLQQTGNPATAKLELGRIREGLRKRGYYCCTQDTQEKTT